jgi:hypothetical protein
VYRDCESGRRPLKKGRGSLERRLHYFQLFKRYSSTEEGLTCAGTTQQLRLTELSRMRAAHPVLRENVPGVAVKRMRPPATAETIGFQCCIWLNEAFELVDGVRMHAKQSMRHPGSDRWTQ